MLKNSQQNDIKIPMGEVIKDDFGNFEPGPESRIYHSIDGLESLTVADVAEIFGLGEKFTIRNLFEVEFEGDLPIRSVDISAHLGGIERYPEHVGYRAEIRLSKNTSADEVERSMLAQIDEGEGLFSAFVQPDPKAKEFKTKNTDVGLPMTITLASDNEGTMMILSTCNASYDDQQRDMLGRYIDQESRYGIGFAENSFETFATAFLEIVSGSHTLTGHPEPGDKSPYGKFVIGPRLPKGVGDDITDFLGSIDTKSLEGLPGFEDLRAQTFEGVIEGFFDGRKPVTSNVDLFDFAMFLGDMPIFPNKDYNDYLDVLYGALDSIEFEKSEIWERTVTMRGPDTSMQTRIAQALAIHGSIKEGVETVEPVAYVHLRDEITDGDFGSVKSAKAWFKKQGLMRDGKQVVMISYIQSVLEGVEYQKARRYMNNIEDALYEIMKVKQDVVAVFATDADRHSGSNIVFDHRFINGDRQEANEIPTSYPSPEIRKELVVLWLANLIYSNPKHCDRLVDGDFSVEAVVDETEGVSVDKIIRGLADAIEIATMDSLGNDEVGLFTTDLVQRAIKSGGDPDSELLA